MKRCPLIIAVVVTVAALACVVLMWEDMWMWVAYEKKTVESPSFRGVEFFQKRPLSLPGPACVIPPQVCPKCRGISYKAIIIDENADTQYASVCLHGYWVNMNENDVGTVIPAPMAPEQRVFIRSFGDLFTCTCLKGPTCHPERER